MKYSPTALLNASIFWAFSLCLSSLPRAAATVGQASLLIPADAFNACGVSIQDSDMAAAVSTSVFDAGAVCGDTITVEFEGRSVELTVLDESIGIASAILMTQAAYTALEASVLRPITVNWVFD